MEQEFPQKVSAKSQDFIFLKCDPFNQKFRDENQIKDDFVENLGIAHEVVLFSRNLRKMLFHSSRKLKYPYTNVNRNFWLNFKRTISQHSKKARSMKFSDQRLRARDVYFNQ